MFFKKLEVPVLAMFHKELMGELLCTRAREVPDVVSVRFSALHTVRSYVTQCGKELWLNAELQAAFHATRRCWK